MINRKAVYIVDVPGEPGWEFTTLGIDMHIYRGMLYFQTGPDRGHGIEGHKGSEQEDGSFTWIRDTGEELKIRPLTIEAFKRKYYKLLFDQRQAEAMCRLLNTTEDLWEYYRQLGWVTIGEHPADDE